MQGELEQVLNQCVPFAQQRVSWGNGMELTQDFYMADDLPPEQFISSVRAVVLKEDKVLVLRDKTGNYHLLPGGRRDEGETLMATLRKIAREARWRIADLRLIGFMHFHHLSPKPPGYR